MQADLTLTPLDVGFDPRVQDMEIVLPRDFGSVLLEQDGRVFRVEGTREELIAAIEAAGYMIAKE